jgi:anti-sigma factor RsiW
MRARTDHPPEECRDVINLLTEYMEGGLRPAIKRALEDHLEGCAACAGYLSTLQRARDAVALLRCDVMPAEVHRRLRDFLDARRRPPSI